MSKKAKLKMLIIEVIICVIGLGVCIGLALAEITRLIQAGKVVELIVDGGIGICLGALIIVLRVEIDKRKKEVK